MTDILTKTVVTNCISTFPIGKVPTNREETLSKAAVVSFLARFQEQFFDLDNIDEREETVRKILGTSLSLTEDEKMPSFAQALDTLHISLTSINDFAKVQQIKEQNENFDITFNLINNVRKELTTKVNTIGRTR